VTAATIARLEALKHCPVTFQEYVEPRFDVRVTWIGGEAFAMRIDTPSSAFPEDSRLDLRVKHERWSLPDDVRAGLNALMTRLGLRFGAIDFRVDAGERYHFLEVNPAGQFAYVEILTGLAVIDAMASLLVHGEQQRDNHAVL